MNKQQDTFLGQQSPLFPGNRAILVQKLPSRYRLYPHPYSQAALDRAFGCERVVWNHALALGHHLYQRGEKYLGGAGLQKRCLTQARQSPQRSWLAKLSTVPLAQSVRDLDQAFRAEWGCLKGRGRGKVCAPRFKTGHRGRSRRFTRNAFRVEGHTLRLTKVGSIPIPITWSRELPAEPGSVTILKDTAGRYCASFVGAVEPPTLETRGKSVGMDPGLASLAVTPEGEMIAPPRFLRSALQRIRRLRRDPGTVVLEDLNVWGMAKNRKPARAIAAGGWLLLRRLLASKAEMYGREVRSISRWQPRSQTCSACGHLAANEGREEGLVRPCPEVFSLWDRAGPRCERHRHHPRRRASGEVKRLWSREAERLPGVLASGSEAGTHLNEGVQACAT